MLAVVGGTGLYELPSLHVEERLDEATPFGPPSAPIVRGRVGGEPVLFLARHGRGHRWLPHEIDYRANVYALKRAGATQLLGISAVGSLSEAVAPGELALPSQYFDWTRGTRARSFFGGGVAAHVSTAQPVSERLAGWVADGAAARGLGVHRGLTYACVEGPRFGTRAESLFLRQAGCHLVGMTNVPEAFLAREAQLGYAALCIVTDYDCWQGDPAQHASVGAILERYGQSLGEVAALLAERLTTPVPAREDEIATALKDAVLTPDTALDEAQCEWLGVLRR